MRIASTQKVNWIKKTAQRRSQALSATRGETTAAAYKTATATTTTSNTNRNNDENDYDDDVGVLVAMAMMAKTSPVNVMSLSFFLPYEPMRIQCIVYIQQIKK